MSILKGSGDVIPRYDVDVSQPFLYREIFELSDKLKELEISHTMVPIADGYGLVFYRRHTGSEGSAVMDIIQHRYSYGADKGLLEASVPSDDYDGDDGIRGYLTVEEALKLVYKYYVD